jgi:hypothetical protein
VSVGPGALHMGQDRAIVSGFPSMVIVVVAISGCSAAHSVLCRCELRLKVAMCLVYFSGGLLPQPRGRRSAAVLSSCHLASTLSIRPTPGACLTGPLISRRFLVTLSITAYRAARWSEVMRAPVVGSAIAHLCAVSVFGVSLTVACSHRTATAFDPQSLRAFCTSLMMAAGCRWGG